jgi:hypothetical protein
MIYLLRIVEYVIIAHFSEKNNPSYEKGLILQGKTPPHLFAGRVFWLYLSG